MAVKQAKITESDIQRQIKEYLQLNGWFVVKIHQSLGSYKGIADLYALKEGKHVWIEVKMPNGRLSEHQVMFRAVGAINIRKKYLGENQVVGVMASPVGIRYKSNMQCSL